METSVSKRSSLSRKKVLRRRRTSDRGGSKRPSVTDHPHGAALKQVTPVKRASFRGVFLTLFLSYNYIYYRHDYDTDNYYFYHNCDSSN